MSNVDLIIMSHASEPIKNKFLPYVNLITQKWLKILVLNHAPRNGAIMGCLKE